MSDSYEKPKVTRVRVYRDAQQLYRFEGISANGEMVVESSESYKNRGDALGAATSLFGDAQVDDQTETAAE